MTEIAGVWTVFAKVLFGKIFADRGYIKQELFDSLFSQGIQLVHGLKAKMKNKTDAYVGQDYAEEKIHYRVH